MSLYSPAMLGIIPARAGSTRFPEKPLALIGGRPMIQWVVDRALSSQLFDEVIVATDDERIAEAARQAGADARLTDSDIPNGTLRSYSAMKQWEAAHPDQSVGWVLNIQGDEPFVHHEQLQKLTQLIRQAGASIATLARPKLADDAEFLNPNRVKVVCDLNGKALYFSRSAIPHAPGPWLEHVGLYAFSRGALEALTHLHATDLERRERLEQMRWLEHGWHIMVGRTHHATHAVDTPEDLIQIENMLSSGEVA